MTDIQQARDVLDSRDGDRMFPDPGVQSAIDALLADELAESGVCHCGTDLEHHHLEEHGFVDMGHQPNPFAERIAAAILAADGRMSA